MPRMRNKGSKTAETDAGTDATTAETEDKGHFGDREFKYLHTPAVVGGVIVGVENMDVPRPMNENDLAEVLEIQAEQAHHYREAEAKKRTLLAEEDEMVAALASTRKQLRDNDTLLIDLGARMATVVEEVGSKQRKTPTKVTLTLTPQHEIVFQDAETGKEVGQRRNAHNDEMERGRQPSLNLRPEVPHEGVRDDKVVCSVSEELFDKSIEAERKKIVDGPLAGHKDPASDSLVAPWELRWQRRKKGAGEKGRLYAEVPKSILETVAQLGSKMDFRAEEQKPEEATAH